MARPSRPASEVEAVKHAAALLPPGLSISAKAGLIARGVVAELIADAERSDPFDRAMADARRALLNDPVAAIAFDPEADLAGMVAGERISAFEARGCVQIDATEWAAETANIAAKLEKRLKSRFRRKLAETMFSPTLGAQKEGQFSDRSFTK